MALEDPLLLFDPSSVSYQDQARFIGKQAYHVKTNPDKSYRLISTDLEETFEHYELKQEMQNILLLN